ncbi:MAG: hypothetical protein K6G58_00125 [Lachnospiraceae bacterium]|nr:hypothetical protein [Lachnospiraceae bacterium]
MKKIIITLVIAMILCLTACKSSPGKISVETQSYVENGGKLEKTGWKKAGSVDVLPGEVIYTNGQISATVGNVGKDSIQVKFSGQVVDHETNKPGDVFNVKKNRTYTFIAGGGTTGLEIKLRYNN